MNPEDFPEYEEMQRLCKTVALRYGEDEAMTLHDAHWVATALWAGQMYHEACGQMNYTTPGEIRDVLLIRLNDPKRYESLPFAGILQAVVPIAETMSEGEKKEVIEWADRQSH